MLNISNIIYNFICNYINDIVLYDDKKKGEEIVMARFDYESFEANESKKSANSYNNGPRVLFFGLKNDGDTAIVRFIYKDKSDFDVVSVHKTKINNFTRNINCLRESASEPLNKCPFCAAGEKISHRFFVKLVEYTTDETGAIVATPKVWERPVGFARELISYSEEYGDLRDNVFKIKRVGKAGDKSTTYSLIVANPNIYKEELYKSDFSAFDSFKLTSFMVLDKSADDMESILDGTYVEVKKTRDNTQNVENKQVARDESITVSSAPTRNNVSYEASEQQVVRNNVEEKEVVRNVTNDSEVAETTTRPRRTYSFSDVDKF